MGIIGFRIGGYSGTKSLSELTKSTKPPSRTFSCTTRCKLGQVGSSAASVWQAGSDPHLPRAGGLWDSSRTGGASAQLSLFMPSSQWLWRIGCYMRSISYASQRYRSDAPRYCCHNGSSYEHMAFVSRGWHGPLRFEV